MQVRENRADHTASAYSNDRIADICSLLAAKRKPFCSIVDAMPVVYFDTPAGQAMICCWKRIMLWLGIGMMGLQLAPDTGETRERARRISRSCFPTIGLHAPALLYNIIPGISLYNNNGFPIIMGHKIHVILGVF
jgi:hypothetical protein